MNLGFDAISQLPISQVGADNTVTIIATGNNLVASIGSPNIAADAVTEIPDPNRLTLGLGTITISADANITATGSQVVLNNNLQNQQIIVPPNSCC